jgi:hypothetical protein
MSKRYLTAESVCAGHPDKLCDIIADSILEACLRKDKASRVACEVMATKGKIIVAGEISCSEKIDIRYIVRNVLKEIGYNPLKFLIYVFVHKQSVDIATGVDTALEVRNGINEQYGSIGAGDQGTVYGYATKETGEMLPLPLVLSHRIVKRLDVLSILENFKRNAGEDFAAELDILTADMRSSSYEAALTRFEARFNSPMLSDITRGLIGVLRGDDGVMYFQMLSHDMKQLELQRLKSQAMKIPPKIRVFSFAMLMCFIMTYMAIIVYEIITSLGGMF